jgi:hypothetical protein
VTIFATVACGYNVGDSEALCPTQQCSSPYARTKSLELTDCVRGCRWTFMHLKKQLRMVDRSTIGTSCCKDNHDERQNGANVSLAFILTLPKVSYQ